MTQGRKKKRPAKGRRIHRLLKLVNLLQSGRAQTTRTLAEDCGVSRRTVFRDLEILRDAEIGIEFDEQAQSFVMNGARSLPAMSLTAFEALSVLALCHHLGGQHGLPFLQEASSAALKIESNLPALLRDVLTDELRTMEIALLPRNPLHEKQSTFQAIKRSTVQRRCMRIKYLDATKRKEILTKLSPYRVFFHGRSWYVIGRSSLHRSKRTFNIDRVLDYTELDETFRVPRGFSVKRHFGNAWRMIPASGPDQRVVARFSSMVARNVAEVQWHPTQKVRWRGDGSMDFEVKVSGIGEICWWLLSYGDQVEVLRPKALRDLVRKRLTAAARQYELTTTTRNTKRKATAPKRAATKKASLPKKRSKASHGKKSPRSRKK